MKTISAVAMLLMASQAIVIRSDDDPSLFDDEDDARDTLSSIQSAEKEHNHKMQDKFSNQSMRDTVQEKTVMKFSGDDEFQATKQVYPSMKDQKSFVQIDDDLFVGRPINEILMSTSHAGDTDDLDDQADEAETLESLASAERVSGAKLGTPAYQSKVMSNGSANKAADFLADDERVYTKYLSDAFTDKEAEMKMAKQRTDAEDAKRAAEKKKEVHVEKKAEMDFMAMHFNQDDDFVQIRFIDGGDALVKAAGTD